MLLTIQLNAMKLKHSHLDYHNKSEYMLITSYTNMSFHPRCIHRLNWEMKIHPWCVYRVELTMMKYNYWIIRLILFMSSSVGKLQCDAVSDIFADKSNLMDVARNCCASLQLRHHLRDYLLLQDWQFQTIVLVWPPRTLRIWSCWKDSEICKTQVFLKQNINENDSEFKIKSIPILQTYL